MKIKHKAENVINYVIMGTVIPKDEIEVKDICDYFKKAKLEEKEIIAKLKADTNIIITGEKKPIKKAEKKPEEIKEEIKEVKEVE